MPRLLIAQIEHEPPVDHGVVLVAVALLAVVGVLVYAVIRRVGRRRPGQEVSSHDPETDREPA